MSDTATMSAATAAGSGPLGAVLFLHACTGLHVGAGTALGSIDLPIQRERHTHWPTIAGSGVKGILRDACRESAKENYQDDGAEIPQEKRLSRRRKANNQDPMLTAAFGPGDIADDKSAYAGALNVTDARILAFPVRSVRGVFAWVTCPAVLQRLRRDLALVEHDGPAVGSSFKEQKYADCAADSPLLLGGAKLVLEEFEFTRRNDVAVIGQWLDQTASPNGNTDFEKRLVVLHDDFFTAFVRNATEITARVGLNYETKTVRKRALFYQESLPPETLLYALVFAHDSRRDGGANEDSKREMLQYIGARLAPRDGHSRVLQFGGDETTGKGLCAVRLSMGKRGRA